MLKCTNYQKYDIAPLECVLCMYFAFTAQFPGPDELDVSLLLHSMLSSLNTDTDNGFIKEHICRLLLR